VSEGRERACAFLCSRHGLNAETKLLVSPNRADLLDSVIFRTGIIAALRSKKLGGKVIGVMITASHNPAAVKPFFKSLLSMGLAC
jgi:hypothetical protein